MLPYDYFLGIGEHKWQPGSKGGRTLGEIKSTIRFINIYLFKALDFLKKPIQKAVNKNFATNSDKVITCQISLARILKGCYISRTPFRQKSSYGSQH